MKAMVLAAGLGTRLRPLTDNRPKALVEVAGRTLLEITLSRLRDFGIGEVIVNVHHFAETIISYLEANDNFGMHIEVSREDVALETGGGLKKAAHFFLESARGPEDPFILHNADVISTIDLSRMLKSHVESEALATLAVQDRKSSRYLLFDDRAQLCGRRFEREQKTELVRPAQHLQALAFSGIHVISTRFLDLISEEGEVSIITPYMRLAASDEKILAFRADEYYWRDLGTLDSVAEANRDVEQKLVL
jgi:mannose-1-phosphate guanylyltransferase